MIPLHPSVPCYFDTMWLTCIALASLTVTSWARTPYVIGGAVSEVGAWPWMGSLEYDGQPFCGCSLIAPQWVLTAAHCIEDGKLPSGVVFALHDLWDRTQGHPEHYTVEKAMKHEHYMQGAGNYPNDIALVKLSTPVNLGHDHIDVIDMASTYDDFTDQNAILTGWGLTNTWASNSEPLQVAELKIHKSSHCNLRWRQHFQRDTMICAGVNMQRGACDGDSGGPLVVLSENHWKLVGVVSWVRSGCQPSEPTVFTKVAAFRKWIDFNMERN